MVQMDQVAYKFSSDGKATKASMNEQLPFVMVCVFQAESRILQEGGGDTMANLRETFKKGRTGNDGKNTPMPFAVRGAFSSVQTQHETLENVQGTIFGYAVPPWAKEVSGPSIQCAFLSGDKTRGGTVVDFKSTHGTFVEWARTGRFHLGIPHDGEAYEKMDF